MRKASTAALLLATFVASAEETATLPILETPGKDRAPERLVEIQKVAQTGDPVAVRALAAAFARLEADPASGFSPEEKVAILRALGSLRDPAAGPCACRGLRDASHAVRRAALEALWEVRDPEAVPALIELLERPEARDAAHLADDLGIAARANEVLEVLANRSLHFSTKDGPVERQIAVTRWRQWWEANRALPRREWQAKGFEASGIKVALPVAAEAVPALLDALKDDAPAWIRENAWELLAALEPPPAEGKVSLAGVKALAQGLSHADAKVQERAATALFRVLRRGGRAGLPDPAVVTGRNSGFLPQMKTWWEANAG